MVDLIKTDNKFFNKIIMAFASLCEEATEMERHAKETFYQPLAIFGEIAIDQTPTDGDHAGLFFAHCRCGAPLFDPVLTCDAFATQGTRRRT